MSQQNQILDVNETIAKSEAFIAKYKKILILSAVAIAAVVALGVGAVYYLNAQNEKAQAEIALGQKYFVTGEWDKALKGDGATFKGYEKIASDYAFTDAANIAHLYVGLSYFNKGEYKKAIEHLEAFSPKGDASISPNALAALANAYVAEKQLDKAVSYFKKAADKADNPALSPLYLIQAGEILESQNKKEEANKIYTKIKTDYPTSQYSMVNDQNGAVVGAEIDKYIQRTQ
ncbi:hypothetical protein EII14_06290 [Alloprevotella sp. OH1205_COT-284]|uniref:tetratricopeptide repeat protein n=1 Tax=Alloprevotella sp. OH1205_COT-284 TaxID=2491043 RepID=UPI000F5D73F2|nr:tetratricopeptide repeat protein [Alloprevotella sp. OH1205_COT-284]RRD79321.1 hypothetical protein EII14_06290 [Alloprevotella sp. OH1205_COT-284]